MLSQHRRPKTCAIVCADASEFLIDTSTIRNRLNPFVCNTDMRSNR
jgi:hypothetical protein